MKHIKMKILIITSIVCLTAIIPGAVLWEKLPESIPIHFDIYNNPDNFAPKEFAVFGLPVIMTALQAFLCIITDITVARRGECRKLTLVSKWIIPAMTVILEAATLAFALGAEVDIRRVACFILGVMLIALGDYLPKLDYIKNYDIDKDIARKINRISGYLSVIMGVLMLVSLLFAPIFSVVCLLLIIATGLVGTGYTVYRINKK